MERDYGSGQTLRDAHPKMHGFVRGEFVVEPGLSDELRVCAVKATRTFKAWVRFVGIQSETVSPDKVRDICRSTIKLLTFPARSFSTARKTPRPTTSFS